METSGGTPHAGGMKTALARFAAGLVALLRTRAELAGVEFVEERERLLTRLALLAAGAVLVALAALFAGMFIVVLVPEANRLLAIALVTAAYAILGAVLIVRAKAMGRDSPAPFAATLAELDKDRLRLKRAVHDAAGGDP